MIIDHYIMRHIVTPMLLGTGVLLTIFVAYSGATTLNDVASGELGLNLVLLMMMLHTLTALEVLLPTALYFSVIFGLGRLYRNAEMTALHAVGVSPYRVLRPVLSFSLVIALIVGLLSLFGRPWVYQTGYALQERAAAMLDLERFEADHFHVLGRNGLVISADHWDAGQRRYHQVFVQGDTQYGQRLIYARQAQLETATDASMIITFTDGYSYELFTQRQNHRVLDFNTLTVRVHHSPQSAVSNKRRAKTTAQLAHSDNAKEIAEYQWRLSTPVATLLLGLLAIPLSRGNPRQERHRPIIGAIAVFLLFFNFSALARTWVEQGNIPPLPGIWWVHGLLLASLVWLLRRHR